MHSLATIQTSALTVAQKQSLETFYRAFSDKNPSLLDAAVTLDWQDIPLAPGQSPGSKGMKPLMQMFFTAFPDLQIIVDEVISQPDRAGVRARMVATHQGEIFGLQPTMFIYDPASNNPSCGLSSSACFARGVEEWRPSQIVWM